MDSPDTEPRFPLTVLLAASEADAGARAGDPYPQCIKHATVPRSYGVLIADSSLSEPAIRYESIT
jgi:hypothetical protein